MVVVVTAVGGGVVDGGVVDQAIAKDAMDAEAAASFVVGIIIITTTPPKIIAPPFERLVMMASPPSDPLALGAFRLRRIHGQDLADCHAHQLGRHRREGQRRVGDRGSFPPSPRQQCSEAEDEECR